MSAGSSVADIATGLGSRIGRHFSVTGVLPGLFLTLWVYLLVTAGADTGALHIGKLDPAFGSIAHVAWLALIALAVGLFLHPLQFPLTQLLEGYWGVSATGRAASASRIQQYRRRQRSLADTSFKALQAWTGRIDPSSPGRPADGAHYVLDSQAGDLAMADYLRQQEADRLYRQYPQGHRVMPTRLGNVLRRFEDSAGRAYGLNIIQIAPHLHSVADERQVAYVRGAREEMDTAIGLCLAGLIAAAASVALLIGDRWWLLASLVPYGLAYLAYRGAVAAAAEYGTALTVMVDLGRFDLYERMHLPRPVSFRDEQRVAADLTTLLSGAAPRRDVLYNVPQDAREDPVAKGKRARRARRAPGL